MFSLCAVLGDVWFHGVLCACKGCSVAVDLKGRACFAVRFFSFFLFYVLSEEQLLSARQRFAGSYVAHRTNAGRRNLSAERRLWGQQGVGESVRVLTSRL